MSPVRFRPDPLCFGIRASALYALYRQRLARHALAELLAGAGIAVGVALVFGVLVANGSILGSTREVIRAVAGSASLEIVARSPHGFSRQLADRAWTLPGVSVAAPVLRENAVIQGPKGRVLGQLAGLTHDLVRLEGAATRDLGAGAQLLSGGVGLPSGLAHAVGARTEHPVTLIVGGVAHTVRVRAVLDAGAIGALAESQIVVALLVHAQALAGERGRVTEVLIEPQRGERERVQAELRRLVAGVPATVEPVERELRLAQRALKPTSQSTTLFAAISVMIGFLLALNAMLLTVPERRRQLAEMREQGFDSRQVLVVLGSQALALGVMASAAGIGAGYVLARTLFAEVPSYLASAFPITGHQEIRATTLVVAFACGLLASVLASMSPVLDLRRSRSLDAVLKEPGEPGQSIGQDVARSLGMLALAVMGLATLVAVLDPGLTIAAGVVLALAAPCAMPLLFGGATRVLEYVARRYHGGMLAVAKIELGATATRSVALACITALAIYGSIAVGGARTDLMRGLDEGISQQWSSAAVWVTPDENIHDTDSFRVKDAAREIARAPGVASVDIHQGAFLDVGSLRLWVRAVGSGSPSMILPSQLVAGDLNRASALMSRDGWATVSSGFASERHLHVGSTFALQTPSGRASFRVAALTTNIGWPPGTITLNTSDYKRYWQDSDPTTFAVTLKRGVTPAAGKRSIAGALGRSSGLRVQTARERIAEVERIARQGLSILGDISTMLLIISALALAAALSTAIYQRRERLASLKAQGFDRLQLWRGLLVESVVVLGIGCLDGALLGVYGHGLADRYLRLSTGFPAPFTLGAAQIVITLLFVSGVSLMVIVLPGYSAAGISPEASFQE
jgi:putative ABC transport system permease protein